MDGILLVSPCRNLCDCVFSLMVFSVCNLIFYVFISDEQVGVEADLAPDSVLASDSGLVPEVADVVASNSGLSDVLRSNEGEGEYNIIIFLASYQKS